MRRARRPAKEILSVWKEIFPLPFAQGRLAGDGRDLADFGELTGQPGDGLRHAGVSITKGSRRPEARPAPARRPPVPGVGRPARLWGRGSCLSAVGLASGGGDPAAGSGTLGSREPTSASGTGCPTREANIPPPEARSPLPTAGGAPPQAGVPPPAGRSRLARRMAPGAPHPPRSARDPFGEGRDPFAPVRIGLSGGVPGPEEGSRSGRNLAEDARSGSSSSIEEESK